MAMLPSQQQRQPTVSAVYASDFAPQAGFVRDSCSSAGLQSRHDGNQNTKRSATQLLYEIWNTSLTVLAIFST